MGSFLAACLLADLVLDMEIRLPAESCNSLRFEGGVTGTGRVYYNGTSIGATAVYTYNCPLQNEMVGVNTQARVCQSDGTWSGSVPKCLPKSMLQL